MRENHTKEDPPQFPVGGFTKPRSPSDDQRRAWIDELSACPTKLRLALAGLSDSQLDVAYRNWTIRQIVHHLTDSHVNSYVRFKWALTEETPIIKAYDEGRWSNLRESQLGAIEPSLELLQGLHARWCQLLTTLSATEFERAFVHPETQDAVTLNEALAYYVWHGKHHTGQILWLRDTHSL